MTDSTQFPALKQDQTPENDSLHLLQTPAWGEFKSFFGWHPVQLKTSCCSAQILFKALPLGYSIAYLPKGPVGSDWQTFWPIVERTCKERKAIFLQVEPDLFEPKDECFLREQLPGFTVEKQTLQPRRTIVIDLQQSEDELLAGMKQKTRYNVRLAQKKGVTVRASNNVGGFYELMQTTGKRDGFQVHNRSYYQKAFDLFSAKGKCVLLGAFHEDQALAYLMLFMHGKRAWYFYGASNDQSRNLMPTYLLQWEAMRWAKQAGAEEYDLWGIPDADEEELERDFTNRADGLWGVYRFKRGFGGQVVRTLPAFIKVYRPILYKAFKWLRDQRAGGEHAPA